MLFTCIESAVTSHLSPFWLHIEFHKCLSNSSLISQYYLLILTSNGKFEGSGSISTETFSKNCHNTAQQHLAKSCGSILCRICAIRLLSQLHCQSHSILTIYQSPNFFQTGGLSNESLETRQISSK